MSDFIRNYKPLPQVGELSPGIEPGWKFGVLILQAEPDDKVGSIIIAAQTKDDEKLASVRARIVAMSPIAFTHPDWPKDLGKPYAVGDEVFTKKFPAGLKIKGEDGREYMLVDDGEILGRVAPKGGEKAKKAAA